jgi:hypothetical protein
MTVGIMRPYRRNCRQFNDGSYANSGKSRYIEHPKYAKDPDKYIRPFLLIQKDLQKLFDYIEPSDTNLKCHSYRVHEILLRACIEVEANCKAILRENEYSKGNNLDMRDYVKINKSHRLSSYRVKIPYWDGTAGIRVPFNAWANNSLLPWYQAYNSVKHNRHEDFKNASFEHATDAVCGLVVLLSSQFCTNDFGPSCGFLLLEGSNQTIGDYFQVEFPYDWPAEERYAFDWNTLSQEPDPFQNFPYDS